MLFLILILNLFSKIMKYKEIKLTHRLRLLKSGLSQLQFREI